MEKVCAFTEGDPEMAGTHDPPVLDEHVGFAAGMAALARCIVRTAGLILHERLHEPANNVGRESTYSTTARASGSLNG